MSRQFLPAIAFLLTLLGLFACAPDTPAIEQRAQDDSANQSLAQKAVPQGDEQPGVAHDAVNQDPAQVVARVNGKAITRADLNEKVAGLTGKFKEMNPDMKFPDDKLRKLEKNFLDRLITDMLLQEECDRRGITVTPEEVTTRIEQVKKIFGDSPESQKHFEDGIKDWNKFREEVEKQARVQKLYDLEAGEIAISDQEAQTYYTNNPDKFNVPDQLHLRQILVTFKKSPTNETETEQIKEQARTRAKEAWDKLKAGETFDALAPTYSDDKTTASKGGDMGFVTDRQIPPQIKDAALALKPGELSPILESPTGFHILKLEDRKSAYTMTFEEAADKIKQNLIRERKADSQKKLMDTLKANAKIEELI